MILCFSCLTGLAQAATNLISDPGFETMDPSVWKPTSWQNNPQSVRFNKDLKVFRSGKAAVRIENLKDNDSGILQTIPVKPNRVYQISGWVKTLKVQGVQSQKNQNIGAGLCLENTWIHSDTLKNTQQWTFVKFLVRTGTAQTTLPIVCRIGYWGNTVKGVAWFDDIGAEMVDASAGQNIPVYGAMANPNAPHKAKTKPKHQ